MLASLPKENFYKQIKGMKLEFKIDMENKIWTQ